MAYCINHPTQPARAKCKVCASALCNECKLIKPGGVFCSEKCYTEFQRIHDGVVQSDELQKGVRGKKRYLGRKLLSLVYLLILLGLIYFVLRFLGIDVTQYIPL